MSLNITTKTAQDVANEVKRQFGDESGVQVKDADILRWINNGQKEIVVKNKVLKGKATLPAVPGQADYSLPAINIAVIESIHWEGIPIPGIPYIEVETYIHNNVALNLNAAKPLVWYEWAGVVTFWPTPQQVDTISVLYTKVPDPVGLLTDTLLLPDKYFNSLVKFVLAQAYEMDEDWEASNYKTQQMEADLNTMADEERTTSNMSYPVINEVVEY